MKKAFVFLILCLGCSKSSDPGNSTIPTPGTGATPGASTGGATTPSMGATSEVPSHFKLIYGATKITSDGTYVTIEATGAPDHKSVYYATNSSLYETFSGKTYNGLNFAKNPNSISSGLYTFKIPVKPVASTKATATPLGPIGISLNGVPFYNQYAGPNQPLTGEMTSFDQYYGHPAPGGKYHYHVEPIYLTQVKVDKMALLGFLLDGFPVYGPWENGKAVTNANLDVLHGHTHATTEFPAGIYHYHITQEDPYINGNGFYGTPGTVSQ